MFDDIRGAQLHTRIGSLEVATTTFGIGAWHANVQTQQPSRTNSIAQIFRFGRLRFSSGLPMRQLRSNPQGSQTKQSICLPAIGPRLPSGARVALLLDHMPPI